MHAAAPHTATGVPSLSTALASLLACTYRYREIAERKRMQLIGRWLSLVLCIYIGLVPVTVAAFLYPTSWSAVGRMSPPAASAATADADADADAPSTSKPIHIAYAGNSMIYFHDTPRFFANLATKRRVASHDCCLRGGASLPSLFREGNGMRTKFRTLRESETDIGSSTVSVMLSSRQYDFLIMNDYTQAPARIERREETLSSLQSDYLPLIRQCGATPVFIITPAYRKQVNNSTDLGSPESFTMKTQEGCEAYASVLDELLPDTQKCRIAPVGLAYLKIREENPEMWERLFHVDDFHPSPHGTFLQGCVLHWTLFGCGPAFLSGGNEGDDAVTIDQLWRDARLMQPLHDEALPLPTMKEATYLAKVAEAVSFTCTIT